MAPFLSVEMPIFFADVSSVSNDLSHSKSVAVLCSSMLILSLLMHHVSDDHTVA